MRELRQRASEFLRRVESGETIQVTDRGRPIALLSPIPDTSPLDRLRRSVELSGATRSIAALPDPLELPGESPSEVLERLRDDER